MLVRLLSRLCLCLLLLGSYANARQISFDLQNTQGRVTEASYPGKYMLLALGYTSCPDICPTTLYEFANTLKLLKNPDAIVPVFVSIDPVHDTAETMQAYAQYFDKRIVGLTGPMEKIKNLTSQLGATFGYRLNGKKVDLPTKGSGYTVYHSSLVYLINPAHELVDVFDYQIGAEDLAKSIDAALSATHATQAPGHSHTPTTSGLPVADTSEQPKTEQTANHTVTPPTENNANCSLPDGFTPLSKELTLKEVYPEPSSQKVVLLNLWATWCAPCRVELPILDKFAHSSKDMAVHTLNLGNKKADIDALFKNNNIRYLGTHSSNDFQLLKKLGGKGLPFNALFVDGKQVAIKHGIIEETASLTSFAQCINHKGEK